MAAFSVWDKAPRLLTGVHCRCRMIAPSRRDSVEFRIVPVPRQEFIEFAHRLISNAGENVGEPSLRIDLVSFAV
jgi:hypothetical protein